MPAQGMTAQEVIIGEDEVDDAVYKIVGMDPQVHDLVTCLFTPAHQDAAPEDATMEHELRRAKRITYFDGLRRRCAHMESKVRAGYQRERHWQKLVHLVTEERDAALTENCRLEDQFTPHKAKREIRKAYIEGLRDKLAAANELAEAQTTSCNDLDKARGRALKIIAETLGDEVPSESKLRYALTYVQEALT